ncbi:MAG: Do family serine endopeptidase [Verrucomicrobiota bacterium]|nr:Do family serine endopeptidase [Verrucomicrobiota bacterium]
MKNFFKFLLFVVVLSFGISLLYSYRVRHGSLLPQAQRTPEKYTLATTPTIDAKDVSTLAEFNRERRALVANVVQAVVSVKTSKRVAARRQNGIDPFEFFFRNPRQFRNPDEEAKVQNSLGSGVIVSKEGHIITNNHVVDQVDDIEVQLADGQTRKARLIGSDAQTDLAVLKIDNPGVKPLKLGDSDAVQAGDMVLAVGNPFGFEETVTEGIISSRGRPNRLDGFGDFLQTDAAINPGNSGGPLIDLRGEVIGINTAIISRTGGSQGIGFAIPSNTVRVALESLLKNGRIIRGYLGILAAVNAQGMPVTDNHGVTVGAIVPDSPAASAQLQKGDVILKFNGKEVSSFPELRTAVAQTELNKKVDLQVERGGKELTLSTELKEQPTNFMSASAAPQLAPPRPGAQPPGGTQPNAPSPDSALSEMQVQELTPALARQLDLPNGVGGVVVTDAPAELPELQRGDVIEEIDQQPVNSAADFQKILSQLDGDSPHVLSVCRHRVRSFVVVRPQ